MNKKLLALGLAMTFVFVPIGQKAAYAEVNETAEVESILELSLEDAIEYALENSLDMEVTRRALDVAEITYQDDISDLRKLQRQLKVEPRLFILAGIDDSTVQKILVDNGYMRRGVEFSYNRAKWDLETKENQVSYNVEKAYFDLLQMEKELEIAKENLELAQKQYDHGKLRLDVGMISQQQLLGLDFNLSQARSGYDTAKIFKDLQLMSFRNTLGMDFDKEFLLTDAIEMKEYDEIDLKESVESALEENLAVIMAKENFELTELLFDAIKVKYPDITYRYRQQAAEVAKAEQSYIQTKNGIEMQVRSAILGLQTAEKQIATFEKAVFQASEGVRIAELSFELGQNTATEVAQANLNLMNAKKSLSQQIHAYNMALLDYKYSIGIGKGF